ncbi:MAG TPA: patatin-like phospholipase family protein [Jatrophihabitans sp.]|nr:patatin-like phospholipase family protein [Jatrophihabitans sp.]
MSLAVVLGGGGSAALGWHTGVLAGLADARVELPAAATLIGTSAGAIIAIRLATDPSAEHRLSQYRTVLSDPPARAPEADYAAVSHSWAEAVAGAGSAEQARSRIGALALAATTISPARRRQEIAELVPRTDWPATELRITAVSAQTGRLRIFRAADGVALLDAVGASCAVPGVWPPVWIGGEAYVDGAVRSPLNLSVAAGHQQVLVLAPMAGPAGLDRELAALTGAQQCVIAADAMASTAFGTNPLDPAVAAAAARAGYRQGSAAADEVRRLLSGAS